VLDRADGGLQVFEVPTGKPLTVIRATDVPERDHIIGSTIGFTADGKHLAGVCWKGRCGIWETATGRLVRWLESGRFYSVVKCDFSPDGKLLAVGAGKPDDGTQGITVGVYEVESGRQLFTTPGTNSVFAPDGKSLITWNGYSGGGRQTSRLLEVPSGKVLSEFTHNWQLHDFFAPTDGVRFFEVTSYRAIKIWDAAAGKVQHTLRGPEGAHDLLYVRHAPGRRELIGVEHPGPPEETEQNAEVKELPSLALSYFDPELKQYRTLTQPAVKLSMHGLELMLDLHRFQHNQHLTAGDWEAIDAAFTGHTDPLFREKAGDDVHKLFQRILNLAPPPIGVGPAP
jgi:WD40 repeat protein